MVFSHNNKRMISNFNYCHQNCICGLQSALKNVNKNNSY